MHFRVVFFFFTIIVNVLVDCFFPPISINFSKSVRK